MPINQEAERSRNWDRIRTRFLRSGSGRWTKVSRGQVEVVGLWIERHCFGPELCLDGLNRAKLVRRIFVEYMDYAFARRRVRQTCCIVIDVGVHTVPERECLNDHSVVCIHDCKYSITASDE